MEMEERIVPAHAAILKRILGDRNGNGIPKRVVNHYFRFKTMTDKVDGHLSVSDLARICLDAGFDPDTGAMLRPDTVELPPLTEAEMAAKLKETEDRKARQDKEGREKAGILEVGTKVRVLADGHIQEGKIDKVEVPSRGGAIRYTVDVDGAKIKTTIEKIEVLEG